MSREPYLPDDGSLDYLRDDAPYLVCSCCGRKSWGSKPGDWCGMPQPDGTRCEGTFAEPRGES